MPKLRLNPIVLIVINILAPSMYIFLNGSFLKIYLVIFATVHLLAMGCFKIFFITAFYLRTHGRCNNSKQNFSSH